MTQMDKLIARLWAQPEPKDFTWHELVKVMTHYGYEETQGNGSRVKFQNAATSVKVALHRPHPTPVLKPYQIRLVKQFLEEEDLAP